MKKVVRSNTKKLTGIRTWQDNLRETIAAPLVQSVQRRENCGGGSGGGGAGEAGLSSSGRFSRADDENFQVCWKCQCLFCNCQNVPSDGVYLTPDFGAKQFFSYCCSADIGPRLPANQLYNKKNRLCFSKIRGQVFMQIRSHTPYSAGGRRDGPGLDNERERGNRHGGPLLLIDGL